MLVDKLFKGSAILYIKWRRGKGRTGELFYENSNHFTYEISEVIEKTPTIYASYRPKKYIFLNMFPAGDGMKGNAEPILTRSESPSQL